MSEKLNHFICPLCGHDFYDKGSYSTCDACQCCFYLSQSRTSQPKPFNPTFRYTIQLNAGDMDGDSLIEQNNLAVGFVKVQR